MAPPGAHRNTADLGPEVPTPAKLVHQSTGGVNGEGGWFLGFSRVGSSIPPSVWAEEVGERLYQLQPRREKASIVTLSNSGGFQRSRGGSKVAGDGYDVLQVSVGLGVAGNG